MDTEYVEAGVVQKTQIEVRTTGNPVKIGKSPHVKANHYIQESRPYITNRVLHTYKTFFDINIMLVFAIWLVISLITIISYWKLGIVSIIINSMWLGLFIQHMIVVRGTIPYILKQPIVPNNTLRLTNDFIEIEVKQVKGIYAISQDAGIGILQSNQGKIKFHVLSEGAASIIRTSRKYSIIGFICSLLMAIISAIMVPVSRTYNNS